MKNYYFKDRLYLNFWTVAKNELYKNSLRSIADDNWFVWKVWKLINRCYCRLIPKIQIRLRPYEKWLDFGWLIWNLYISWYKKTGQNENKTSKETDI